MKKFFVLFLALLTTAIAQAASPTFTLTWAAPVANTDGTAITGAITYQVYAGAAGKEAKLGNPVTSGPYVITPAPAAGTTECFYVTAIVNSVESAPSGEACGTIPFPTPGSPVTIIVTIK